jgi:hypothetical protein
MENKMKNVKFDTDSVGHLFIEAGGIKYEDLQLKPCFPWSCNAEFISVLSPEGYEVHRITSLKGLDENSRALIEDCLKTTAFTFQIEEVLSVEDKLELRHWDVITKQGQRKFQTALNEWPLKLPTGDHLIRDIAKDLYTMYMGDLDLNSRKLVSPLVD